MKNLISFLSFVLIVAIFYGCSTVRNNTTVITKRGIIISKRDLTPQEKIKYRKDVSTNPAIYELRKVGSADAILHECNIQWLKKNGGLGKKEKIIGDFTEEKVNDTTPMLIFQDGAQFK